MNIITKLFKKKKDEFSFDTPSFSSDSVDHFAKDATSDPFLQPNVPNTTGMPSNSTPLPPMHNPNEIAPTTGSKIARDYLRRQELEQQGQPAPSSQGDNHNVEVINLKLDAIKSSVDALNQRLDKLESARRLWK